MAGSRRILRWRSRNLATPLAMQIATTNLGRKPGSSGGRFHNKREFNDLAHCEWSDAVFITT